MITAKCPSCGIRHAVDVELQQGPLGSGRVVAEHLDVAREYEQALRQIATLEESNTRQRLALDEYTTRAERTIAAQQEEIARLRAERDTAKRSAAFSGVHMPPLKAG